MAVNTVNEIVINHIMDDTTMDAEFSAVYYMLNDSKGSSQVKNNYAIVYLIDDTKDVVENCPLDQGQARFACEVYEKTYDAGINNRQAFQGVMKLLESTVTDSFSIDYVKILNVNDNSDRNLGLFNMNFECIVNWRQN